MKKERVPTHEFQESGALLIANRGLQIFGYELIYEGASDAFYPVRVPKQPLPKNCEAQLKIATGMLKNLGKIVDKLK